MDLPGSLRRLCTLLNRPGSCLLFARRQEAHQAEKAVTGGNQLVKARFLQSEILKEHLLLIVIELRDLLLDLCADHKYFRAGFLRVIADFPDIGILSAVIRGVILRHIRGEDYRLCRQEIIIRKPCFFLLPVQFKGNRRLPAFQMLPEPLQHLKFFRLLLIISGASAHSGHPALQHFQIGKNQFQVNRLYIAHRVNRTVHMDDIRILEAAHHMYDRVAFTDIGQELVAQTFAFRRPLDQSRDIHEFNHRRGNLLRLIHIPKQFQPFIRDRHHAHIRVDGAERIIR